MGRGAGSGFARHALAAVVAGAAVAVAACGGQHAAGGGPASRPASASTGHCARPAPAAGHMLTFGRKDDGKVICVARGTTVGIYLQGTPARRWSPISTASPALAPVPNGRLMLRVGVTGAFFKAVSSGVATVTSSRPSCQKRGTSCGAVQSFRLTLVVIR
ncbi:MAG: hypothetical protein J2P32_16050 [Actinobacteria bacterium]|nr:hypothetical protein [Actinomycetota bacterium]